MNAARTSSTFKQVDQIEKDPNHGNPEEIDAINRNYNNKKNQGREGNRRPSGGQQQRGQYSGENRRFQQNQRGCGRCATDHERGQCPAYNQSCGKCNLNPMCPGGGGRSAPPPVFRVVRKNC